MIQKLNGIANDMTPVFKTGDKEYLSVDSMNLELKKLSNNLGLCEDMFSCHSFRAGILTALAYEKDSDFIMDWGRWKSTSVNAYIKSRSSKKRCEFLSVVKSVLN